MKENLKVVVRMLPANLNQDTFWKLIEEKVNDKFIHWYFVNGLIGYLFFIHFLFTFYSFSIFIFLFNFYYFILI